MFCGSTSGDLQERSFLEKLKGDKYPQLLGRFGTVDAFFQIDWRALLLPKMSLLEIVLRGVLVYLSICILLRVILRRQAGQVALSDLLVITLVSGVCRNPLIADAYSIGDGLGVIAVILASSYSVDWLCFYNPVIHAALHPSPTLLIRDGIILKENLETQLMTEQQLRRKTRGHGLNDPAQIAEAWMEGDGQVTVIKKTI
jgi:uncharacterized membrane protein YcaP (DUF421 family)